MILFLTHFRGLRTSPAWFVAVTIRNPFLDHMDWDTWVTCSYVDLRSHTWPVSYPAPWLRLELRFSLVGLLCDVSDTKFKNTTASYPVVSPYGVRGWGFEHRPGNTTCVWLLIVLHTPSLDILVYDIKQTTTFGSTVTSPLDLVD